MRGCRLGEDTLNDLVTLLHDDRGGQSLVHFVDSILRVGGDAGRGVIESLRDDPQLGREATAQLAEEH